MRTVIVLALLLAFLPTATWAGDCHSCGKCKSACTTCKPACQPKCDTCKPRCDTCKPKCDTCKPKCDSCKPACKPTCEPKCGSCQSACKPACGPAPCNTCGKSTCGGGCGTSSCGVSAPSCAPPCACMAWHSYCGCEMVSSLCITLTACEGTAGPLKLLLRDRSLHKVVEIELAGPVDCYYNMTYTFDKPVPASSLGEAVLINATDDPATITSLRIVGMDSCFSWTFVDHTCPGVLLGPGGCTRMVIYGG